MTENTAQPTRGQRLVGAGGKGIGTVDAVFADYLLVRTHGLLPVDLYVPRSEVTTDERGRLSVPLDRDAAYAAWHRPLKRVEHD
ncbi:MAG TPA: hypothetical protein VH859_05815 [Candidatus Limnocylindria bacterium]